MRQQPYRQLFRGFVKSVFSETGTDDGGGNNRCTGPGSLMADTMLFGWIDEGVEGILLLVAMIAFVAILVVLDLKQRGL